MRAILVAAKERDLFEEFGCCVRIPGAENATLAAWDTNERERFLDQEGITVYTTRASVPNVLRPFLIAVRRSDSAAGWTNPRWVRYADLKSVPYVLDEVQVPGDFFRVRSSAGVVSVKLKAQVVAGDRPVDWTEVHSWFGIPDDLGET